MAAEDFFTRWSKKKNDASSTSDEIPLDGVDASQSTQLKDAPAVAEDAAAPALPTQEDVEKLTHESDYSPFMADGVDESVKRSAMKKLFTDPHYNIMDGLDVYIDDYSKFEPISPELLASLSHAKALLDPLSQLKNPIMRLLEKISTEDAAALVEAQNTAAPENQLQDDAQAALLPDADLKTDFAEAQPRSASENQDSKATQENVVQEDGVQDVKAPSRTDDV
jgi:hypothetical protein